MGAHAKRLGLVVAMLGCLGIAAPAQAAPKLYSGTLSIQAFGVDAVDHFSGVPLGAHCNPYYGTTTGTSSYGTTGTCGVATIQQGAPLTGSGTASTNTIAMPPGFALPASGLARITSGSFSYYFPYIYSYTYADLRNRAGSFFAGGGPGSFSLPYKADLVTVAKVAAKQGPNQFGGTMRLLGFVRSRFAQFRDGGRALGSIDWRFDLLGAGAMTRGGVVTAGYTGTATGMYYHTALMQTGTSIAKGTAFPWTTGTVTVTAPRGPIASVEQRKGYDHRTSMGQGTIQLVTPLLTHWLGIPSPYDTVGIGVLRIVFTDVEEVEIEIDIKPGRDPNSINPSRSSIIPVAILSRANFDALSVDPATVCFGADPPDPARSDCTESHDRPHIEDDVDGDGDVDLVLHFDTSESGIAFGDTEACLTGATFDGTSLKGCDVIRTVRACGIGFELVLLLPPLMWLNRRLRCGSD